MPTSKTYGFLNTVSTWGGGEKWHLDAAHLLHKNGHNVIVYVNAGSELETRAIALNLVTRSVNLGKYSYLNPLAIRTLASQFSKDNISTLIMNLSSDMKVGAQAATRAGVERVIYRRGSAIPIKNSATNRRILGNHVHEILANSQATVETVFEKNEKIFDRDRVTVIYNPIPIPNLTSRQKSSKDTRIIIGNVGRLYKQKGQHYLIELAQKLKDESIDFVIKIAGEGVERSNIEQAINQKNLSDYVKLIGFQEDLSSFYQELDVFAMTSLWEGFGYVIAEAMSFGVPAVGFDISSNPELIKSGINGELVPMGDVSAFAEAIINIHHNRPSYSQEARRYVLENFEQSLINSQILDYIVR